MPFFQTVTDLAAGADVLRRRRYGVIEIVDGQLASIRLRPFPKIASVLEAQLWGQWLHNRTPGNRCRLFYNQPRRFGNFLAAAYAWSSRDCTLASVRRALAVLDEIARLKGTDAILCDVVGSGISQRLLNRWGWQAHAPSRWHRNYIKRFYGRYST